MEEEDASFCGGWGVGGGMCEGLLGLRLGVGGVLVLGLVGVGLVERL